MTISQDKPFEFYGRDNSSLKIPEKTVKKGVDFSGLSKKLLTRLEEAQLAAQELESYGAYQITNGFGGVDVPEAKAKYIKSRAEKVISAKVNSYISLGKDRPSTIESGYGGIGHTQASAINIVAGPMGFLMKSVNEEQETLNFNPSFEFDAARIYLSQKADIDGYMGLRGSPGAPKSVTRSAIAMRSDAVRITARENIRLVTGFGDGREADFDRRFNSQGSRTFSVGGIDLVAGNDTSDMQPLVKGTNLIRALQAIIGEIDRLNGIVDEFIFFQTSFNAEVIKHEHLSNWPGNSTAPKGDLLVFGTFNNDAIIHSIKNKLKLQSAKLENLDVTYLKKGMMGRHYINSILNHTN